MNCQTALPYIGEYLDSELDARTSLEVSRHLDQCGSCRERFAQERRLESTIVESLSEPIRPALWKKIEARVRRRSRRFPWLAVAASLSAAAAVPIALLLWRHEPSTFAREALRCHERILAGAVPLDIREPIAAGMGGRLGFGVHLSALGRVRARIDSAAVCALGKESVGLMKGEADSQPATFLVLHRRVLSMFPGSPMSDTVNGYNFRALVSGDVVCCAVGKAKGEALDELLRELMEKE